MATKLESLLVQIDASTELLRKELQKGDASVNAFATKTEQQLAKVDQRFSKFGSSLRTAFAAFGVGLSVQALASFGRNAIETADAIGESARAAGIGAERFQRLQFVFKQNGVEASEFEGAMRKLNQGLGAFITTGGGPAAAAIKRLGLEQDISNGKIRTAEQFYDAIVDRLKNVKSGAEAAALSAALFGREAGTKLAPVVRQGTEALKEAEKAATGILSDEQIAKADALNDAFDTLAKTVGGKLKGAFIDAAAAAAGIRGVDAGSLDQRRAAIPAQRKKLEDELQLEQSRGPQDDFGSGRPIALIEQDIKDLAALERRLFFEQVDLAEKARAEAEKDKASAEEFAKITEVSGKPALRMLPMPALDLTGRHVTGDEQRAVDNQLSDLQEQALRSQKKMAEAIQLAADRQIAEWQRVAKETPELADEAAQAIVLINERAADDIKTAAEKAKGPLEDFARSVGSGLQNTLANAFRGVSTSFGDLLKDMLAQLAASGLLNAIGGAFAGATGGVGGFLAEAFKGFASGGRPPMGRASIVGEHGPELFVPDVPGRILSNAQSRAALASAGGGINVTIQQHNQYGSGPQYDADLMVTARVAAKTAYDAVMKTLGGRR